jgi:short-subunit dehydrogenase
VTDFHGRTITITGATGGIARAILEAAAGPTTSLVLQARDETALDWLIKSLEPRVASVTRILGDLTNEHAGFAKQFAAANPDVLINNAAIYTPGRALDLDLDEAQATLILNTMLPWALMQAVLPGMVERGYGRVVNISSGSGSFAEGLDPGHAAYAVSKAALNAVTVMAAGQASGDVKINAMCPGWVRTKMGGPSASRSPEEGADTALWLASLPADGPTGGVFRDRRPIGW